MKRLVHWLLPLAVLVLMPASVAAQSVPSQLALAPADRWHVISAPTLSPTSRTSRVDLTRTQGRSKGLRISVRRGALLIDRVVVTYSNGQVHYEEPDRPIALRSPSDRLELDVRTEERFVDAIEISYRIEGRSPSPVQILVEAAQSPSGRNMARPEPRPRPVVAEKRADDGKAAERKRAANGDRERSTLRRSRSLTPPAPTSPRRDETASDTQREAVGGSRSAAPSREETGETRVVAAVAEPDKPYATVDIYFGTNRKREADRQKFERKLAAFGPQAQRELTLGKAVVTVPKENRRRAEVTRPEWDLIVARFALRDEDLAKDFTIFSVDVLNKRDFLTEVQKQRERSRLFRNQAFIFVHGFNVSFDDALFRAAQIAYDIEFDGLTFMFSWPSRAGLSGYILDRDRARNAKAYLNEFIQLVEKESGAQRIHLIAHSMGADPLLEVLQEMASRSPPGRPARPRFGEIILAAPDVTVDNYLGIVSAIGNIRTGMTLYASSNDWALRVSQQLRLGEPIAGLTPAEGPIVRPGIDTIDVSLANTDFFSLNHSTFADRAQLLKDISALMATGKRPPNKRLDLYHTVMSKDGLPYWKYEPGTSSTR